MKHILIFFFLSCLLALSSQAQFAVFPPAAPQNFKYESASMSDSPSIKLNAENSILIFPNPATDFVWLQVASATNIIARLTFFDINGRKLLEQEFSLEAGSQKIKLVLPGYDTGSTLYARVEMPGYPVPKMIRILRQM